MTLLTCIARALQGMKRQIHAQWARLDILWMMAELEKEFAGRNLLTTHVLYTDMDVFFAQQPPLPTTTKYGPLHYCGNKKKSPHNSCQGNNHGVKSGDLNFP